MAPNANANPNARMNALSPNANAADDSLDVCSNPEPLVKPGQKKPLGFWPQDEEVGEPQSGGRRRKAARVAGMKKKKAPRVPAALAKLLTLTKGVRLFRQKKKQATKPTKKKAAMRGGEAPADWFEEVIAAGDVYVERIATKAQSAAVPVHDGNRAYSPCANRTRAPAGSSEMSLQWSDSWLVLFPMPAAKLGGSFQSVLFEWLLNSFNFNCGQASGSVSEEYLTHAFKAATHVVLVVSDCGAGAADAQCDKLLQAFALLQAKEDGMELLQPSLGKVRGDAGLAAVDSPRVLNPQPRMLDACRGVYVDVVCSAFGHGSTIMAWLCGSQAKYCPLMFGDHGGGQVVLALRALPHVYTYYPTQLGFDRTLAVPGTDLLAQYPIFMFDARVAVRRLEAVAETGVCAKGVAQVEAMKKAAKAAIETIAAHAREAEQLAEPQEPSKKALAQAFVSWMFGDAAAGAYTFDAKTQRAVVYRLSRAAFGAAWRPFAEALQPRKSATPEDDAARFLAFRREMVGACKGLVLGDEDHTDGDINGYYYTRVSEPWGQKRARNSSNSNADALRISSAAVKVARTNAYNSGALPSGVNTTMMQEPQLLTNKVRRSERLAGNNRQV